MSRIFYPQKSLESAHHKYTQVRLWILSTSMKMAKILQIIEIGMRVRFIVPLAESIPTAKVTEQVEAQVDKDILAACAKQPLSSSEIAIALGHKKLSGNLRKALPRLKKAGLLEYTIPEKPNSRLQKYRLTDRGRNLDIG